MHFERHDSFLFLPEGNPYRIHKAKGPPLVLGYVGLQPTPWVLLLSPSGGGRLPI